MATMMDPSGGSARMAVSAHEEATRQAPPNLSELERTSQDNAPLPRAAYPSEPPRSSSGFGHAMPPSSSGIPRMSQEDALGGTLVMETAPPRPGHGVPGASPLSSTGVPQTAPQTAPMAFAPPPPSGPTSVPSSNPPMSPRVRAPASAKATMPSRRKKRSRALTVFFILTMILAVSAGGAYAAWRFVLVPRGISLPFGR
jgi:hypothetical protein